MQILMIVPFFDPHQGGVEKHVKCLSQLLVNNKIKPVILTNKYKENLADFENLDGIQIYRYPFNRISLFWIWLYKNRKLILSSNLIHCHDYGSFFYYYLPFYFLFPLKKVYLTFHGHEGIFPIPKSIIIKRKLSEKLTRGNICVGDYIKKWYYTKSNFVIYGGIEKNIINSINKVNKDSLLFFGRLEKDTGIITYLKAMKILKDSKKGSITLHVCGEGSLDFELKKMTKENNLNVKFHGFVKDPLTSFQYCDNVFVTGYLSILEAIQANKLIFCVYDNLLKKDYIEMIPNSRNLFIIAKSASHLAKEIIKHIENPILRESYKVGYTDFLKNRKWVDVLKVYFDLWGILGR